MTEKTKIKNYILKTLNVSNVTNITKPWKDIFITVSIRRPAIAQLFSVKDFNYYLIKLWDEKEYSFNLNIWFDYIYEIFYNKINWKTYFKVLYKWKMWYLAYEDITILSSNKYNTNKNKIKNLIKNNIKYDDVAKLTYMNWKYFFKAKSWWKIWTVELV